MRLMNEKNTPFTASALLDASGNGLAKSDSAQAQADAAQNTSSATANPGVLGVVWAEMQSQVSGVWAEAEAVEEAAIVAGDEAAAVLDDDAPFALSAPTAAARVVSYARDKRVAFAPHATQELLENPQWMSVPGGAYYARGLLHWQNRLIPFIDLESLLLAYPAFDAQALVPYAMVLAYQTAQHEPLQYGAIALTDIPHTQTVSDADFNPLPSDSDMWAELAISCFKQNGQVTPILDAAKIFSRYHG